LTHVNSRQGDGPGAKQLVCRLGGGCAGVLGGQFAGARRDRVEILFGSASCLGLW